MVSRSLQRLLNFMTFDLNDITRSTRTQHNSMNRPSAQFEPPRHMLQAQPFAVKRSVPSHPPAAFDQRAPPPQRGAGIAPPRPRASGGRGRGRTSSTAARTAAGGRPPPRPLTVGLPPTDRSTPRRPRPPRLPSPRPPSVASAPRRIPHASTHSWVQSRNARAGAGAAAAGGGGGDRAGGLGACGGGGGSQRLRTLHPLRPTTERRAGAKHRARRPDGRGGL